jgi:hypothetical protein
MIIWENLVPDRIAQQKSAHERRRRIMGYHRAGLSNIEIGRRFDVSAERIRQLLYKCQYDNIDPIERYLAERRDVARLFLLEKGMIGRKRKSLSHPAYCY